MVLSHTKHKKAINKLLISYNFPSDEITLYDDKGEEFVTDTVINRIRENNC